MNATFQARSAWYDTHYEVISHDYLSSERKRFLGAEQQQICRYCGQGRPATSFSMEAHAISLLMGNKTLFDALECDACNAHFGKALEDHLAKWMHPFRTMGRIDGRNGAPNWKSRDGQSRIEVANASNLRIWLDSDNYQILLNEDGNFFRLPLERQPYVPMGVFKALIKMALAVMPSADLTHCEHLKRWILSPTHSFDSHPYGPLNIYLQQFSGPAPTKGLAYWLLRRRPESEVAPYLTFALQFSNLSIQVILPMHEQDRAFMHGKHFELGWFPLLSGIGAHEEKYGPTTHRILDMSNPNTVKGDQESMRFKYQSIEVIPTAAPTLNTTST